MKSEDVVWTFGKPLLGFPAAVATRLRSYGAERMPRSGGAVLAINHFSWIDIPCIGYVSPRNLYFLAKYDKGYDLWKYGPRKKDIKLVAKFDAQNADLKLGAKGKKAYVLHDGKLSVVDLDSEKATPVGLSAKMDLDPDRERAYMFEHIWRQTLKKFLDVKMHRRPLSVSIEVTKRCNARCDFCDYWKITDKDELTDFTDVVRRFDPLVVVITGGEPMLRMKSAADIPR